MTSEKGASLEHIWTCQPASSMTPLQPEEKEHPRPVAIFVRIVSLDHYMAAPQEGLDVRWSALDGAPVQRVPIVRIFGSTPGGQTACVHLHNAFPYFYVPYYDDLPQESDQSHSCLCRISAALEFALNMQQQQQQQQHDAAGDGTLSHRRQRIFNASLVKAIPFYGYYPEEGLLIKISLYNPKDIARTANLLRAGAIFGRSWEVYEAHVPYLLQIKIDFNLHGMGWLKLQTGKFRLPIPTTNGPVRPGWAQRVVLQVEQASPPEHCPRHHWTTSTVPPDMSWSSEGFPPKQTTCELELDATAADILNVMDISRVPFPSEEAKQRKLVESLAPLWDGEEARHADALIGASSPVDRCPQNPRFKLAASMINRFREAAQQQTCLTAPHHCRHSESRLHADIDFIAPANISQHVVSLSGEQHTPQDVTVDPALLVDADLVRTTQPDVPMNMDADYILDEGSEEEDDMLLALAHRAQGTPLHHGRSEEYKAATPTEGQDALRTSSSPDTTQRKRRRSSSNSPSPKEGGGCIPQVDGTGDGSDDEDQVLSLEQIQESKELMTQVREWLGQGMYYCEQEEQEEEEEKLPVTESMMISDGGRALDAFAHSAWAQFGDEWWGADPTNPQAAFRKTSDGEEVFASLQAPVAHTFVHIPPPKTDLSTILGGQNISPVIHQEPFYSVPSHAPKEPLLFAGAEYRVPTSSVQCLRPFSTASEYHYLVGAGVRRPALVAPFPHLFARSPPTATQAQAWLHDHAAKRVQMLSTGLEGRDPNTGKLLPDHHMGDDLLETPDVGSMDAQKSTKLCTPALEAHHAEEDSQRIPSPKYDEQTCFYTNPYAPQSPPRPRGTHRPCVSGVDDGDTALKTTAAPKHVSMRHLRSKLKVITPAVQKKNLISQMTPPSLPSGATVTDSQLGFKVTIQGKGQQLTLLSIEIQAKSRSNLLPHPKHDAVQAIALSIMDDDEEVSDGLYATRLMYVDPHHSRHSTIDALPANIQVDIYRTEAELLNAFEDAVISLDPDIVMGYEIQKGSLGYLAERAHHLERSSLLGIISRSAGESGHSHQHDIRPEGGSDAIENPAEEYAQRHASGLYVSGRIVLNVWRLMRQEIKLGSYTLEACVAAVMRRRIPQIPVQHMSRWFEAGPAGGRWRCLSNLVNRARMSLALLDQLDLIGRTGEMARVFGIDFFSVLTRGSQYRVESMMLRLAKSQNYVALSPSKENVARQPAMESIPLVMEPESRFYVDPVIVLDFQSLYPSLVIAYNLCYSTCIGKSHHVACGSKEGERPRLGVLEEYAPPAGILKEGGGLAPDDLVITPNGVAFLPAEHRNGVLPRLLKEILETRVMIKMAMKQTDPKSRVLLRCLNARQFSLKLIANVTYGYTSAGFSGRMPMAELADAIVSSGRATLEETIRMVDQHPEWKAKVVYGDTDSLFVCLPGRSRDDAFRIGAEIASTITAANPAPVTLKMEKVYHPCVLLSKKRYVGMMYEHAQMKTPTFDAKGIETVRRDACPAVAKLMERSLRILFATKDLSQVKEYLEGQWLKILTGRVSVQDFVFAKEVRLGTYSSNGTLPPAAIVAGRAMAVDPQAEPRFGERIPYLVVHGEPGARLVDMVVPPKALIESGGRLRLHAAYYITKQIIPALERVFSLVGADLRAWYASLVKPQKLLPHKRPLHSLPLTHGIEDAAGKTIDLYYLSKHCAVCDELTTASKPLCDRCAHNSQLPVAILAARAGRIERQYAQLVRVCGHCSGNGGHQVNGEVPCESLDCGVYFERRKLAYEKDVISSLAGAALRDLLE